MREEVERALIEEEMLPAPGKARLVWKFGVPDLCSEVAKAGLCWAVVKL